MADGYEDPTESDPWSRDDEEVRRLLRLASRLGTLYQEAPRSPQLWIVLVISVITSIVVSIIFWMFAR